MIKQYNEGTKLNSDILELFSVLLKELVDFIPEKYNYILKENKEYIFDFVKDKIFYDLIAFCQKDPACNGNTDIILNSYLSFHCVVFYRIANFIYYNEHFLKEHRLVLSRFISEYAKVKSGIEIHPASKIGKSLVIDHGVGTVIGETCEIGENCYILQCVILGAKGIAKNGSGKRHPTIGNDVQIGAFTKILGPINIGNNVIISPNCIITSNIPDNMNVTIVNKIQLQKSSKSNNSFKISHINYENDYNLLIYGKGLKNSNALILDDNLKSIPTINCTILASTNEFLRVKLDIKDDNITKYLLDKFSLKINNSEYSYILLPNFIDFNFLINNSKTELFV